MAHQTGLEPVTYWLTISYCYLSQLLANYPYLRNVNTRLLLFNAEAYNDLIEYQFNNIVKLMSGLGMGESIQEKVLKELSTNLASLMVVENWGINNGDGNCPTISSQVRHPPSKITTHCKTNRLMLYVVSVASLKGIGGRLMASLRAFACAHVR